MGGFRNFIFCTRHKMFDVRHYMLAGCIAMTAVMVLVSQTSLQARVIDPGARLASLSSGEKHFVPAHKVKISGTGNIAGMSTIIPLDFKLGSVWKEKNKKAVRLTSLAALQQERTMPKFSPKERVSCSVEAARAAANGDTSKISPCITALLSGDEDALVNLPEKMSAFFIETMNSEKSGEEMANVMINSMMKMMEAITGGVKGSDETPEKTASTAP